MLNVIHIERSVHVNIMIKPSVLSTFCNVESYVHLAYYNKPESFKL